MKRISRFLAVVPLLLAFVVPTVASADMGEFHHFHFFHGNNQGSGTLIVVKKTIGGNGTFQMSGEGVTDFSITTHHHFGIKVLHLDAGTYSISEGETNGWEQVSNSCDSVTVRSHRMVLCTIVNKVSNDDGDDDGSGTDTGSLTVVVNTTGGDGTFSFTGSAGSFDITTSGGTGSFDIADLPVGTYSVIQTPAEGWNQTSFCDSVEVTSEGTATCTITDEKIATTGSIAVIKNTVGGDATFSFTGTGLAAFDITTANGTGEEDIYDVPVGSYTLAETALDGWTLTSNSCADGLTVAANATTTCTIVNTKNAPTDGGGNSGTPTDTTPTSTDGSNGGGGNGPIAGSLGGGGSFVPGGNGPISGSVLGASTSTSDLPNGCTALLKTFMRMGKKNDAEEVKKLQQFLNAELGISLPISGRFGKDTDAAVRKFQNANMPQVLTPWGISDATGYVYKTTQRWINLKACKSLNLPMPELN